MQIDREQNERAKKESEGTKYLQLSARKIWSISKNLDEVKIDILTARIPTRAIFGARKKG